MARLKNITSMALQVPLLDNRVVEPGEIVEVDDELTAEFVWPETNWEKVKASPKKTDKDGEG